MRSPSSPYPADSRPWSQCLRRFTTEPRDKHHQLLSGEEAVSLPDIGMLRPLEYQVLQKRITSEESQRFAPQARAVLNKHAGEHWSIAQNIACLYYAYCHRDQFEGSCRLPAYLVIDSSANETEKLPFRMLWARSATNRDGRRSLLLSGQVTEVLGQMSSACFVQFCYQSRSAIQQWPSCRPDAPASVQHRYIRNIAYCVQKSASQLNRGKTTQTLSSSLLQL